MRLRFPDKAPWEEVTFALRLDEELNPGVTLASATWTILPVDTLVSIAQSIDVVKSLANIKLGGGNVGTVYELECRFTGSDGEKRQLNVQLKIVDKVPPA